MTSPRLPMSYPMYHLMSTRLDASAENLIKIRKLSEQHFDGDLIREIHDSGACLNFKGRQSLRKVALRMEAFLLAISPLISAPVNVTLERYSFGVSGESIFTHYNANPIAPIESIAVENSQTSTGAVTVYVVALDANQNTVILAVECIGAENTDDAIHDARQVSADGGYEVLTSFSSKEPAGKMINHSECIRLENFPDRK